jgi:hypothetical protein
MPEGFTPESVIRTAVDVKGVSGRSPDATVAKREEAAAKIKAAEPPKSMVEDTSPIKDKKEADSRVASNIGSARKKDGTIERNMQEINRLAEAQAAREAVRKFLENGYDKLNTGEQTAIRTHLENAMLQIVGENQWWNSLTGVQKEQVLANLAKLSQFKNIVKKFDREFLDKKLETDIPRLMAEEAKYSQALVKIEAAVTVNKAELTKVISDLDAFQPGHTSANELSRLEAALPTIRQSLEDFTLEAQGQTEILHSLKTKQLNMSIRGEDTTTIDALIKTKQDELRDTRAEIKKQEGDISKYETLKAQKTELLLKRSELEAKELTLSEQQAEADRQSRLAKMELSDARDARLAEEQGYVAQAKGIFSDAATELASNLIQAQEQRMEQVRQEAIANEQDPAKKALLIGAEKRYFKEKTYGVTGKRKRLIPNKANINEDYHNVLNKGEEGLKEAMESMMDVAGMPQVDIDAKMLDSAFVSEMMPKVAERLLTMRIQTGTISSGDAEIIFLSTWGEGMMQKAIQNRKDIQEMEQQLRGEGVLKDATLGEWLKRQKKENKLKFLLLILLGFPIGAAGIFFGTKNMSGN